MGTISYTIPVAGSTFNSVADPEISTALQTILTWANGNVDGSNVSSALTGRRLLTQAHAFVGPGVTAGNYFVTPNGVLVASGASSANAINWSYFDPANYFVTGKSNTQLVVRMSLAANSVAPATNFSGQLYAVTFAGAAGSIVPTSGAAQGTAANIATPSASAATVAEGASYAFPVAGAYAPVINLAGTTAANSAVSILWQLFVLNF